jgi:ketosteroid isomerase-like protein
MNELQDFERFMKRREEASKEYVRGQVDSLASMVAEEGQATFFPPGGGYFSGANEVASTYEDGARAFEPGGDSSRFEILQMEANEGLAYWTGLQHATATMHGTHETVPMHLRITEVFRRDGGEWKMVHRHADTLTAKPPEPRLK